MGRDVTFTNADSTTSSVDEPSTLLHLGDELLVEHTLGLLVQRAVDSDDISLSEHLLEVLNSSATNFLGSLFGKGLVIEVEEFLTVERYETSQDTFTDTSDTNGSNDLALNIEGVLGNGSDVPFTTGDLLVSGDKVADESEHGENDVFSDRYDIGSSNFSNEDLLLIGSSKINVIGTCAD